MRSDRWLVPGGWLLALLGVAALAASCIATSPEGIHRQTDQDAGTTIDFEDASGVGGSPVTGPTTTDPHAVVGATPSHGPFVGGGAVLISGKGFEPDVRVWFGDAEASGVIPVSPTAVQVDAPPGAAGPVELSAQNGDDASTRRTLPAGYSYDALYTVPSSGPVAGGTVITVYGASTHWTADSVATVDDHPCTTQNVRSGTELECTVPKGTPGAKVVRVVTGDDSVSALDAFTYADDEEGFKGGLSGLPLAGTLRVLAFDNFTGDPLAGAHVIVGDSWATALYAQANDTGLVELSDPSLTEPATVTVAATCHSPISFVSVPVDTVVAYLDPQLTPECGGEGDPPPVGGKPTNSGAVTGELVWGQAGEFQRAPWINVPGVLGADEQRIAYLFAASSSPTRDFSLPGSAQAVLPDAPGDLGYEFELAAYPGNLTLYALAGIQNDAGSPARFTAYAMGLVKGIGVTPNGTTGPVYISMLTPLDQAMTLQVSPPPIGPKGPDRLKVTVSLEIAQGQYATLPGCQRTLLLPQQGGIDVVGLPPLDDELFGSRYIASASAATGPTLVAPQSLIGLLAATSTASAIDMTGFVAIPTLDTPALNGAWDGQHLATTFAGQGLPPTLTVYDIASGGGVVRWTIAVPSGSHAIQLPDLSVFPDARLPAGPLSIAVYGARIRDFDYAKLRYKHMRASGMDAYSLDYFDTHL